MHASSPEFGNQTSRSSRSSKSYSIYQKIPSKHSFGNQTQRINRLDINHSEKQQLRETRSTISSNQIMVLQKPQINDFQKLRLLGDGKFGSVYLVSHKSTGFLAALKTIQKGKLRHDEKLIAQLIQEIKLQSYMRNANIIELFTFFSDSKNIYLLMELGCDGQLYQFMQKRNPLHEETTSFLTRQLLDGLSYIHQKGIIHRDLKPENIVLIHGVPKICDFGWSVYCPMDFRSTFCGTPLYLSPEILVGESYNEKIDTWAIGALTYELFTGENPFKITRRQELRKIVTESFKMMRGSKEIRSFVEATLCKDPRKRPDAETLRQHQFIRKYEDLETSDELCS